jgi:hypothetical protein
MVDTPVPDSAPAVDTPMQPAAPAAQVHATLNTPSETSTLTSATTASVFKAPKYGSMAHKFVPPIPMPAAQELRFGASRAVGEGGGYVILAIDKRDGYLPETLMMDGGSAVLGFLQQFNPSITIKCQYDGSPLPEVTSPTPEGNYPQTSMVAQMYFHMERRWQLNPNPRPPSTDKDGNAYPDRIDLILHMGCQGNLKDLVDMAYGDLQKEGLHLRWKDVQEKDSNSLFTLFGITDSMNLEGLKQCFQHEMEKAQEYLIRKQILPFELTDEPVPNIGFSFRKRREGRMPPDVWEQERLSNIAGFDAKVGCKLLNIEFSPKHWSRLGPIFTYMEEAGALRRIARRAAVYENPRGRPETSDVIEVQRNMSAQLQYSFRMTYDYLPDIAAPDKEVEHILADGTQASPKFVSLRYFAMELKHPETGQPLLEGFVPLPNRPGRYQVMYFAKGNTGDFVRKIKKSPAAWFWNYLHSLGLKTSCVQSLMDSFRMETRLFADQSTWSAETWVVESEEGQGKSNFAEDMQELLEGMGDISSDEEDDAVVTNGVEMTDKMRVDLMATIREKDNLEFAGGGGGDDRSRRTGFDADQTTGGSTVNSVNSKRAAALKMQNSELAKSLDATKKENEDLLARLSRLESLVTNQHGTPPDSGGPAAGDTPSDQNDGPDGSAAGQG